IRKTGTSLKDLASAHGYDRTVMSHVMRKPWPAVERIIARRIGVRPNVIWPSRYTSDGSPRPSTSTPENRPGRRRRHRQIEARALT
ncbi:MAG: hypothetical protein EA385_16420, partial [Salinarimonadaceae bacterium]